MAEKKRKFSLIRAFTKAVLGVAGLAVLAYGAWFGAFYAGKGDKLTPDEKIAVTQIFGDQVNPDKIRKHYKPQDHHTHLFRWATGTVPPPFSHIDFFGDWAHPADFTKASRGHYGLFLHEATHCWQGQNLRFSFNDIGRYDYAYKLHEQSRFSEFGTEQQAELVERYAENWLHPEGRAQPKTQADSLVARVIENQFPQAKVTRDSLDQSRTNAPTALQPGGPRNS